MGIFLIFCFIVVLWLFAVEGKRRKNKIKPTVAGLMAIALFSLIVGLRYNGPSVDPDFFSYWDMAKYGIDDINNWREYNRFELIPRGLYYLLFFLKLPPSCWFIAMGVLLITFPTIAGIRWYRPYLPIIIGGFILLYLPFSMNGMRQGGALAVFLLAITYIGEKNWKKFLLMMVIAYCFHRSSIIWASLYLLAFIDWGSKGTLKYIIVIGTVFVVCGTLSYLLQLFGGELLLLMGQKSDGNAVDIDMMVMDNRGSGVGVIIRYIRWALLLVIIPGIARKTSDRRLQVVYVIFLIGAVMDFFSMYSILMSRVALYPKMAELLLYPYIFAYVKRKTQKTMIIRPVIMLEVLFLTAALYTYLDGWQFVSIL